VVPPSPALVRHGSKQRKIPAVLAPGQFTPQLPQAHIPIGVNNRVTVQHPYATATQYATATPYATAVPFDDSPYNRAPPIPATVSNAHVMREDNVVSYPDQDGYDDTKPSFLRILTCRC
jgi:casein kinase 1